MDSREVGMRIGAATNQAVSLYASGIEAGQLPVDTDAVEVFVEATAGRLLGVMDRLTVLVNGGGFKATVNQLASQEAAQGYTPVPTAAQIQAAFPGSQYVPQQPAAQVAATPPQGYNTQFSGSTRPLKLAEHPELDGWLHAQCAAVGVTEVWDNRGKPDYIAAISSGSPKTPPPFRSATKGVDKSFWPPKG